MQTLDVKKVTPALHRFAAWVNLLAIVAGPLLYLFPYHTDAYFAWTVVPPLTAAFLGGAYLSALVIGQMSARESIWSNVRTFFPGMLLSTGLTLIATLLHLDKFDFTRAPLLARLAAWVWLIFYMVAPIVLLALIVQQLRSPGGDLPPQAAPPVRYRIALFGEALILLLAGVPLFFAPQTAAVLWPWKLNLFNSQIVGAWLIAIGFALAHSAYENAWERIRTSLAGNIALGALQLVAVARFASTLEWAEPAAWLYTAICLGMIILGAFGWVEMWSKTTAIG